ncbi:PREDICTED: uncharacterized protein LOC109156844 isoform X2 [Ipomoea nil]|uniref:uncharacterized protein LOC109156844 isoform X2 n=1 Tax=Ipomoea nil TaxID=35883 RepID=UPI000901AA65|nr:PREDICTED: uncharacterized protein LOC109156844 isoform X2 [Ipomoea nil]
MATMTTTTLAVTSVSRQQFRVLRGFCITNFPKYSLSSCVALNGKYPVGIKFVCKSPSSRYLVRPTCALGSGFQTSLSDDASITVKDSEVTLVSQDDKTIQVRVDLTGKDTQIIFDKILIRLGREAPPIPGFRKQKGGKMKIPKEFLLQMLGEDRVTNFVIQEIITSTVGNYVTEEKLVVKENKVTTTQTAKELKSSFAPGNAFGFDAILELEKSAADTLIDV